MKRKLVTGLVSFVMLAGCFGLTGCSKDEEGWSLSIPEETYYANRFGKDVMNMYYLWNAEIADDLAGWDAETNTDPIGTVDRIRYHDSNGYIDKWTMMTDDMSSFVSSVGGVSTTFGWSLTVYLVNQETKQCAAVVNFVHDDTPAARAGLKRGDILLSIDGQPLTTDNYLNLYYNTSLSTSLGRYNAADNTIYDVGKTVELTAVNMYEDPVLCDSVYEFNGKKVGYLAYSAFDLTSISKLIAVCKDFKAAGVRELVLDLRYNGGGYVLTENVLASMLAPQQAVASGQVFEREVYNNYLTEYLQKQGASMETCFATDYTYQNGDEVMNVSTQDANIGLEKIYALIGTGSASASEALLGGLMPYMDVRAHRRAVVGQVLHGNDAGCRRCLQRGARSDTQLGTVCDDQHLPECRRRYALHARRAEARRGCGRRTDAGLCAGRRKRAIAAPGTDRSRSRVRRCSVGCADPQSDFALRAVAWRAEACLWQAHTAAGVCRAGCPVKELGFATSCSSLLTS